MNLYFNVSGVNCHALHMDSTDTVNELINHTHESLIVRSGHLCLFKQQTLCHTFFALTLKKDQAQWLHSSIHG